MNRIWVLIGFLFITCKKQDCMVCTQMLSEDFYPPRVDYPKTTSVSYSSCGESNEWIGNQVNVQRFIIQDTLVTKVLSVDCR